MEGRADRSDSSIPHEGAVEEVVSEQVAEDLVDASDVTALANIAAPSAGYVQAEATALVTSHNKVLEVLRDAGLIPSA